jgi:hypothetical protein
MGCYISIVAFIFLNRISLNSELYYAISALYYSVLRGKSFSAAVCFISCVNGPSKAVFL